MNEQLILTKSQPLPFISFAAKSIIAIALLHALAGLIRDHQIWSVVLGVLLVAAPIFLAQAYSSTVGRIYRLQAFRDRGMIFHLLSGRLLRLVFWLLWAVFAAYFLLINFSTYGGWQWAAIGLVVPVFWFYYTVTSRLVAREMKPYLVANQAVFGARWLTTATMVLINFAVLWYLGPQGAYQTLADAISAQEKAVGNIAGSDLVYWTYQLLAIYDGAKAYLIGAGINGDMLKALVTLLIGEGVIYYSICLTLSVALIPGRELRRVFAPISDIETPPQVPALRMALISGVTVLLAFFIFMPAIANLDHSLSQNPKVSSARARGEPAYVKVEQIGKFFYREGTLRQSEVLRISFSVIREAHRAELIRDAESAFSSMESSVDDYLDWYYSLEGEYSRIAKMLVGDLETHMQNKLRENLERNNPFDAFTRTLNMGNATVGADEYTQELQAILDQNRVELPPHQLAIVKRASLDDFLKVPTHFDVTTLKQRLGVGAVAGTLTVMVAGKIVTKTAGKGILKLGAKAAAKVVASKVGGTFGGATAGAAAGAAIGSFVPILGTAFGAVIGGAIGMAAVGVAFDKGMIELEELWGREKFKAELMAAINEAQSEFMTLLQPQ